MILVTGGTGFIGRHVIRVLGQKVDAQIIRLLLLESEQDKQVDFPGMQAVFGDLSDMQSAEDAVSGVDTIVHSASKNIDHDGTGFHRINVEGTRHLCEAAVRYGVKRVIYISTMGVYGHRRHHDADEMTPVRPDTTFSRSKAEAEKIILAHHSKGDFQGIILRHRFVYGEGDAHVIPRMIRAARKYPFLINRGRAKVSLVLVNDLAEIIGSFALKDFPLDDPPIYHVTDGVPIGYRDIIMILCDAYGFKRPKWSIPFWLLYGPVRLYEILRRVDPEAAKSNLSSIRLKLVGQDQYYSNLKLRRILPNLNFISFREGFPDLIDYYKPYQ